MSSKCWYERSNSPLLPCMKAALNRPAARLPTCLNQPPPDPSPGDYPVGGWKSRLQAVQELQQDVLVQRAICCPRPPSRPWLLHLPPLLCP